MKKIIIRIVVYLSIVFSMAYFLCDIKPATEYGWLAAIWHGLMLIPNFILHFIDNDILYYSDMPTTSYKIFFAVGFVISWGIREFTDIIAEALNSK